MASEKEGLSTTELIQMLINSFSDNDGIENFGFILATYELDKSEDDYQVEVMLRSADKDITVDLIDGITFAFKQFIDEVENDEDDYDDFNYN